MSFHYIWARQGYIQQKSSQFNRVFLLLKRKGLYLVLGAKSNGRQTHNVPRGTKFVYLPMYTRSTLMSEGETPLIRDAWEIVTGRIDCNFSRASNESDFKIE